MPEYFYAYHGPENTNDFDYRGGYGVPHKSKWDKVSIGDFVFVVQNLGKSKCFQLCGTFKIIDRTYESGSNRPYRLHFEDCSKLNKPIEIDQSLVGDKLPKISGNEGWSNFQRHFCRQGATLQNPLSEDVYRVLLEVIDLQNNSLGSLQESFEIAVRDSLSLSPAEIEERLKFASPKPERMEVTTTVFKRNPDVVAAALIRAAGRCEICHSSAPFLRKKDSTPYLEIHHKIRLADGGDDTVANTLALCPNCHREQHFG